MAIEKIKEGFILTKGVFLAYFILVLHLLLIALLGLLVLFFRGFISYMIWIFLGGAVLVLISGYFIYKRMKAEGKTLREMMNSPAFRGGTVEVSLLGGLASLKVGRPDAPPALASAAIEPAMQLEDPETVRTRELSDLARLFEKELITREEYTNAKQRVLKIQ